ncbi:hypothetical protein [Catellatospora coxensis]|uniref:hypothetical protein n=1 Tax=Catellatospora coxensis TaxID=310354 RepID=UPI001942BBA5|nr:hypothetical protein [Catellatospora coxensis]
MGFAAWVSSVTGLAVELFGGAFPHEWLLGRTLAGGTRDASVESGSPAAAVDMLDENAESAFAYLWLEERELALRDVRITVQRFGDDGGQALLRVTIGYFTRQVDAARLGQALVELLHANVTAETTYGQVATLHPQYPPRTRLDVLLRRDAADSAGEATRVLRGYEWATLCPSALIGRLGGVDAVRESGAFAAVRAAGPALLLLATRSPVDYDESAARRVWHTLRPVLPPGRPKPLPLLSFASMVLEDARP